MAFAKLVLCMTALLVMFRIFCTATTKQCVKNQAVRSTFGMMLQHHIFRRITGPVPNYVCQQECIADVRCQSFNFVISKEMCELNDRTKEARPEDYVSDSDRFYFRPSQGRVPLGSIPEVPAETCHEIKASEGGEAASGKYWFDSIVPDQIVLAHCDMETEDVDECNSSIPVCDVNATCENTIGSYRCTCPEAGFKSDGKGCIGPLSFVICEGETDTITCQNGEVIDVLDANYGRLDQQTCLHSAMSNTNCRSSNSLQVVRDECNGKTTCELIANNAKFGGDPCATVAKYLEVKYQCLE